MNILTRYVLATSLVMVLAMSLLAYVTSDAMQKIYLEQALRQSEIISETIIRTTYHRMLENDFSSVHQMIREAGEQEGVDRVRLINKDGMITFSTHKGEVGFKVNKSSDSCDACHIDDVTLVESSLSRRSRRFYDQSGMEYLGLATGIENAPPCYTAACHVHSPDAKLLGMLDVILPLKQMREQAQLFRNTYIVFAAVMLFCLFILLMTITQIYIKNPIHQLVEHTNEVKEGNLSSRVSDLPGGALAELGAAFNQMTEALQLARADLHNWGNTLEARVEERTAEIHSMQAQLIHSERLASIGELSAGIAHEINNPLTGVMLFASMLLANPALDDKARQDLEVILGETRRCADIVKRLLEFSRQAPLRCQEVLLHEALDGVLALLEHQAIFHNVRIVRVYAPEPLSTLGDKDQLMQVVMNIVLNAGQAMATGGELRITTGRDPDSATIWASFRDTGCGIAEEHLTRIFDPFFSTKGADGTGLGLSVSFGIVRNHGGRIDVNSRVGVGTTLIVRLPSYESLGEALETTS